MEYLYRAYDGENKLLYVGVTSSIKNRVRSHLRASSWMEKADFITIERHPTREAVIEAERIAIQTEKPQANIQYQPDEEKRIAWKKTLKQSNRPKPPPVVPLELAVLREAALEETRAATKDLIQAVREEAARGITEVELARRARVARGTIRKWLGK